MTRISRGQITSISGMTAGVAAISVLIALIDSWIHIPNLSILYLLIVMFCAVTWGWWNALGAAVVAFLAYDFFFVEPRFTFTIRDPEEWLALLIFLAVAAVTSNLAARERSRREQASRQARTAMLLYDLSRALASDDLAPALRAVAQRLMVEFRLDGVVIARSGNDGRLQPIAAVGAADAALGPEPAGRLYAPPSSPGRSGRWIVVRAG
jgi:two-component system sensor histidine kinase KdpD